jgi:hypothetical protein
MVSRRTFVTQSALAAGAAALGRSGTAPVPPAAAPIGIQVGAVSFVDEGTEKVLDVLGEMAGVNTLFVATFTYGRGIAGRPRGSAARPREAGIRRQLPRGQLRYPPSGAVQEDQHRAREGA